MSIQTNSPVGTTEIRARMIIRVGPGADTIHFGGQDSGSFINVHTPSGLDLRDDDRDEYIFTADGTFMDQLMVLRK